MRYCVKTFILNDKLIQNDLRVPDLRSRISEI